VGTVDRVAISIAHRVDTIADRAVTAAAVAVAVADTVVGTATTADHDHHMATTTAMSGRHRRDRRASNVDRTTVALRRASVARVMMCPDDTNSVMTAAIADPAGIISR